jgi:hypothetical protein
VELAASRLGFRIGAMKPKKLTQRDIDEYNALPLKEKVKAWESLKRLEELGEIEPVDGLIEKPERA